MTGLRKFLWPLGFSTRYTTHPYEPVDTGKIESLLKSDRPLFVGIERSVPSSAFSRVANFAWRFFDNRVYHTRLPHRFF